MKLNIISRMPLCRGFSSPNENQRNWIIRFGHSTWEGACLLLEWVAEYCHKMRIHFKAWLMQCSSNKCIIVRWLHWCLARTASTIYLLWVCIYILIMILCYYLIKNYNYEDMLLREVLMDQWRFSIRKVANVRSILRMRILILLVPLCLKFEWVNNLFISLSI